MLFAGEVAPVDSFGARTVARMTYSSQEQKENVSV